MIPLDEPVSALTGFVLTQGALGVATVALATAVLILWKANNTLQQARIDDARVLQDARVKDQQASNERMAGLLEKATIAIERQTEATSDLKDAVQRSGGTR